MSNGHVFKDMYLALEDNFHPEEILKPITVAIFKNPFHAMVIIKIRYVFEIS